MDRLDDLLHLWSQSYGLLAFSLLFRENGTNLHVMMHVAILRFTPISLSSFKRERPQRNSMRLSWSNALKVAVVT